MRRVAILPTRAHVGRVTLHETSEGTFLYGRSEPADGPCEWDLWFETTDQADAYCASNLAEGEPIVWRQIADPQPGCQDDWEAPVRARREAGSDEVAFEELRTDGQWYRVLAGGAR
jgi:hypothetical protein